ncbi:glycosyltransferase family 2 protein [Acidimicrobiia bacterium EGI L10123]|uniref:glycosyltransferase family 2 protein n=1 Tax=Salinilacustrithrix flava TaxID=2957203 RepID=UPI003D7C22C3|nr:glycosyltransferase family 2 protein [Acidimicrobiia bacterium EGI L10123]
MVDLTTTGCGVSVCIPVRNGAETLAAQLEALASQVGASTVEVVVADNGSTDDTRRVACSFAERLDLRVIDAGKEPGINVARNAAVRAASHERILFCDADDVVQGDWISQMARALDRAPLVGGTCVETILGVAGRELGVATRFSFLPAPLGACCGLSRECFDAIGGFDESYRGGADEFDFFFRAQIAGYELIESPARVTYIQAVRGARSEIRRSFHRALQEVHLYRDFKEAGMPRSSPGAALKGWALLGLSIPRLLSRQSRVEWARLLGRRVGRVVGSLRWRKLYL